MIKGKNILIVCYGFPPNPGVGGRRWAKFAKYLNRSGNNVNVVAAKNFFAEKSEWLNDINGITVEYLPVKYPKVIIKGPSCFFEKVQYRFWIYVLRLIYRGNYYDRSVFWKQQVQKNISDKILQNKIDTVIVSAGPFKLSYYVVQLKLKFPNIKFITDFRDLWTEDTEISSFSRLSKRRILIEKKFEKETILLSDVVLTVADTITNYFKHLERKKHVYTLLNGYDYDDFSTIKNNQNKIIKDDKIRFIFTGTLYINLSYILDPFFKAFSNICNSDIKLKNKLIIEFYGFFPKEYILYIDKYSIKENVKINGKVPLHVIYNKLQQADICLLFLNDCYRFALSTKFCEYISQNKKVLLCSNSGEAADFINLHNLGYSVTPENCLEQLQKVIDKIQQKDSNENSKNIETQNIINQFSLPYLTNKLISYIS